MWPFWFRKSSDLGVGISDMLFVFFVRFTVLVCMVFDVWVIETLSVVLFFVEDAFSYICKCFRCPQKDITEPLFLGFPILSSTCTFCACLLQYSFYRSLNINSFGNHTVSWSTRSPVVPSLRTWQGGQLMHLMIIVLMWCLLYACDQRSVCMLYLKSILWL